MSHSIASYLCVSLILLCPASFAGQDSSDSAHCRCVIENSAGVVDWKDSLFNHDSEVELVAEYDWPALELWPAYSHEPVFSSDDGEYSYFVDLGFNVRRDEGGKAIVERHSPDTSVFVLHASSGKSFAPFQVGPAGILHDVFWNDENLLIILGMGDTGGVICCVDTAAKKVTLYSIDDATLKPGVSQAELILQRLAPRLIGQRPGPGETISE